MSSARLIVRFSLHALRVVLALCAFAFSPASAQVDEFGFTTAGSGQQGSHNSRTSDRFLSFGNSSFPFLMQAPDSTHTSSTAQRAYQALTRAGANYGLLAPGSVDPSPIPSARFSLGFPTSDSSNLPKHGGFSAWLPPTATSSVDINTVDLATNGSFGGIGGGGSNSGGGGAGGGSGGSGSQGPPDLPPGWTGVMCHGVYAGAIPPGGSVYQFWMGAYGFAGDTAQQEALAREGQWLISNGQVSPP